MSDIFDLDALIDTAIEVTEAPLSAEEKLYNHIHGGVNPKSSTMKWMIGTNLNLIEFLEDSGIKVFKSGLDGPVKADREVIVRALVENYLLTCHAVWFDKARALDKPNLKKMTDMIMDCPTVQDIIKVPKKIPRNL